MTSDPSVASGLLCVAKGKNRKTKYIAVCSHLDRLVDNLAQKSINFILRLLHEVQSSDDSV